MKIKVINLLINLANGVTYTKKARIRYFDRKNDYEDECILNEVAIGYRLYNQYIELNDKVEIIEEKKIPERISINDNGTIGFPNEEWTARNMDKAFAIKINSIIDYLKSKGE